MNRQEAESQFISRVLCDNAILPEANLDPEMFTTYRGVYSTLVSLVENGSGKIGEMDLILNTHESSRHLVSKMQPYTAANWEYYRNIIQTAWFKEQVDATCRTALEQPYPENLETLETSLTSIALRDTGTKTESVGSLLEETLLQIKDRYEAGGKIPGLSFGLSLVDASTLGAQDGQFIFLGARPSVGKSSLGWQMARYQAKTTKVGWISLEESKKELIIRGLAAESKVDSRGLMSGMLDMIELANLKDGAEKFAQIKDNLFIHEKPGMKLPQLVREIRSMARRGCKIVYVDYLQIVKVPGDAPKHEKVGEVSTTLKALARELNIPIVGLGQLKRPEHEHAPDLADIQHSDQPGQDADQAWFLWKEKDKAGKFVQLWLIIRKARNGDPRWIRLEFDGPTLTFWEKLGQ